MDLKYEKTQKQGQSQGQGRCDYIQPKVIITQLPTQPP
jgi:hypothetical protein